MRTGVGDGNMVWNLVLWIPMHHNQPYVCHAIKCSMRRLVDGGFYISGVLPEVPLEVALATGTPPGFGTLRPPKPLSFTNYRFTKWNPYKKKYKPANVTFAYF